MPPSPTLAPLLSTMGDVAAHADFSLRDTLTADPASTATGDDHAPREVRSGHYVPVRPTPLPEPELLAHSPTLFAELGFDEALAGSPDFVRFFSGDLSDAPAPLRPTGWATGYALSIYGQEYTNNCPFGTGNGYGDGRALSVLEGVFRGQRWEMQLKGAGRTPYCRGGDGRAVLRSSVREFLAQEHMHALGVPTSRSLCLIASRSEPVQRPWYAEGSTSYEPDRWAVDPAAISTRVAPSFLRVGQLELFARRARKGAHPKAMEELEQILRHAIDREYRTEIPADRPLGEQLVGLAEAFRDRLTTLVAHWIRVGYCQGNFNSDNTAVGGFTLDYGPFGFMERFDPAFQPWTGGGRHFAFLNQPGAAEANYHMFWQSLATWSGFTEGEREALKALREGFGEVMHAKHLDVWRAKLGLPTLDLPLVQRLLERLQQTGVDYTLFFRALSELPDTVEALRPSFYPGQRPQLRFGPAASDVDEGAWSTWLADWRTALQLDDGDRAPARVSAGMKAVNPALVLREWLLVPAYQQAAAGDARPVRALQAAMTRPYDDPDDATRDAYAQRRPDALFGRGGVAHMSCSS